MLQTATITEQVTAHLRTALQQGRWTGLMPGRNKLVEELGVNGRMIERALEILEQEGLLVSQGQGKRRRIVAANMPAPHLQVEVILYEQTDALDNFMLELTQLLKAAGHSVNIAPKTMVELRHNQPAIEAIVRERPGRAWILHAGSHDVVKWFADAPVPAFALFGVTNGIDIATAAVDKVAAVREAVRWLARTGQQRIVMLTREELRRPDFGITLQNFLEELENQGIRTGHYNLPDWQETREGFHQCLNELFKVTPPAAIIIDDTALISGVLNFLNQQKNPAAREVTLIATDYHPSFDWFSPNITFINWNRRRILNHVVRWVNKVARGKDDRKLFVTEAKVVTGRVPGLQVQALR